MKEKESDTQVVESLWGNIWKLLSSYWWSEERKSACGLLLLIIGLNLSLVYLTVLFNEWNRFFYDALQNKDFEEFTKQILRFSVMAFIYIAIAVYRVYLSQMLEIRWRRWLTDCYIKWWIGDHVYYRMSLYKDRTDNPDQRISEDFKLFTSGALSLSLGFLNASVSVFAFVGILWGLSGPLSFQLFGHNLTVSGYLVWVALLYAVIGTSLAHIIGRPLIGLNFQQQRFEADFRFSLVRVRENAEGIALYGGEDIECKNLNVNFTNIMQNWWRLMKKQKQLGWFSSSYTQIAIIFPFIVTAPRFFSGAIQLGGMMQSVSAFANVQSNLSWFVDNYRLFADWKASANRLATFHREIERAKHKEPGRMSLKRSEVKDGELELSSLCLQLPDAKTIQRNINARINKSEKILLKGASGTGKSTLFRSIAGIWPFAIGEIIVPTGGGSLFLPQKPYIPIGSLREAVSYPSPMDHFTDEEIKKTLEACCLPDLVKRLDEEAHWEHILSPGEQQRLSFARVLLHKPEWIFLDEATSAVDDATQEELYEVLLRDLPDSTVLSVAHRSGVERFHDRTINLY